MSDKWYDKTADQVVSKLSTNINRGLSQKTVLKRVKRIGTNAIYPIPKGSFRSYLKQILTDFTSILLILTAVIAAVFEHNVSAAVIVGILIFNYTIAVFSYVKAQRVLEGMGHFALPTAKVMRDGRLYLVKQEQLIPGDIIFISAGDIVPCDARLIEADDLKVLEVNLTGVARAVEKNADFIDYRDISPAQQRNMIFASTIVTMGIAKAVVCAIGGDTLICKMEKNAPLVTHEKLKIIEILKKYCAVWSLCMIALITLLTFLDLVIGGETRGLFDVFLTGLSLAVASMSEFYMAFGYIAIACGIFNAVQRYKDVNSGAMIKNISKLEELKSVTCLIVPKEGAFSVKNVKIERVFANNNLYGVNDYKFLENCGRVIKYAVISTGLYGGSKLIENNLNNDNIYTAEEDSIISAAEKFNIYNIELETNYPFVEHIPQSDTSLFETTLVEYQGGNVVAVRGEINKLLENCRYYCENDKILPLDAEKINEIKIAASLTVREAFKVVGVASKTTIHKTLYKLDACQTDLTFEGFMGIREPMLQGAAKNISKCQDAGIKVIMLCDDISENNRFLAESLGIARDYTDIVTTNEILRMSEGLFRANIPIYRVYEGLTTGQKSLLVKHLKDDGEVVGYLGRELDEIMLLKESGVGFAQSMTISAKAGKGGVDLTSRKIPIHTKHSKHSAKNGCEAVKFFSDVIISDADKHGGGGFNAVLEAINCAKVIYKNILRVIKYLITVQSARLFIILYSVLTHNIFFTPIQILFFGLLIDFAAVIIIAFEKPSHDMLKQKIDTEKKLSNPLGHNFQSIVFGLFWAAFTIIMVNLLDNLFIVSTFRELVTAAFLSFVFTQIAVLNENMKERSIFIPNVKLNFIYLIFIVILIAFIFICMAIPQVGGLFGINELNLITWGFTAAIPAALLVIYEIYKFLLDITGKNKFVR